MWVEIIGIIATVFVLISMLFKTGSIKADMFMRATNLIGSIIFVVYGCLLPAISTATLNGVLVVVNAYHLILLMVKMKKQNNE